MLCQNLYITLTIILSIIFRCHPHFADDKTSSENWNHFSLKDTAASHSDEAPDPLPNFNRIFFCLSPSWFLLPITSSTNFSKSTYCFYKNKFSFSSLSASCCKPPSYLIWMPSPVSELPYSISASQKSVLTLKLEILLKHKSDQIPPLLKTLLGLPSHSKEK